MGVDKLQPITIQAVRLHPVGLPLVEKLRTSYGAEPFKSAVIVEVETTEGVVGWGECSTKMKPSYAYETMGTALHVLEQFLVPAIIGATVADATEVPALLKRTRGHPLAKHGLEAAVWDALAKANNLSLASLFALYLPDGQSSRGYAPVGVSIGIQDTLEKTFAVIQKRLDEGYGRIKLKIEPGWDVEFARKIREQFPDITLMLDANSAYSLEDAQTLKQLDQFNLLMIEQPLGYNDIYEHSKLQPQLETPICLDESIHTAGGAQLAVDLGACRIINLKPPRVGGFTESLKIYAICVDNDMPLWVGGMLETGVGRAANIAFASLPGVNLPCDISATNRYFDPDITEPPFELAEESRIYAPTDAGIGVEVIRERLDEAKQRWLDAKIYQ